MNVTRTMKHITSVLVLLLIVATGVQAQEIKARATLDRDTILLGDQIHLNLELEQNIGPKIQFPQIPDSIGKSIEVLQRTPIDTIKMEGRRIMLRQDFLITAFDSGPHPIPPVWFKLKYDQLTDSVHTNGLSLFVQVPKVDLKKGPADIKKPFDAPVTLKEIAPWLFGAILILAIIFLLIYSIRRRKKKLPLFQKAPKPKEPPYRVALRKLDEIKEQKLWQHDHVKEYYSRITDTLREYLEGRFDVTAMEKTTDEIMVALKYDAVKLDDKSYQQLKEILELADLVKFAKFIPVEDDNQMTLANAYFFVNQTKVEEKTSAEEDEENDEDNGDEEITIDLSDKKGRRKS
jgi:hypothetical protein